ncbi:Imm1 family immunity protein [Asanoa sp. NPDC050611]|uniref:Imm1 family immunity protein n=1 Tax=Asanoa sp. NPDC050611 TaxID=3157098 RepID=UPI0033EC4E3D
MTLSSPVVEPVRLERDRWADGRADHLCEAAPTPADLEAAVLALDQQRHTEVVVTGHDGQWLAIAGGAGHYTVHLGSDEHDDVIVVRTPDAAPGRVPLVAAGRLRQVPRHEVVDLDTALRAVRAFAEDGRPDPTLRWASG